MMHLEAPRDLKITKKNVDTHPHQWLLQLKCRTRIYLPLCLPPLCTLNIYICIWIMLAGNTSPLTIYAHTSIAPVSVCTKKKHWDQMMRALLQAPRLSSLVWQALALPREKCPTGLACGNSFRFLKRFVSKQQKHRKRWETCEFSGFGPRTTDEEEEGGWFRSLIIDYWLWLIDYDNEWWFCDHHHNDAQVTNGWGGGSYSGPTTASTALSRTRWDLWPLWRLKTSLLPGRPEVVLQKTCKLFLKIPDMYLVQVNKLPLLQSQVFVAFKEMLNQKHQTFSSSDNNTHVFGRN